MKRVLDLAIELFILFGLWLALVILADVILYGWSIVQTALVWQ